MLSEAKVNEERTVLSYRGSAEQSVQSISDEMSSCGRVPYPADFCRIFSPDNLGTLAAQVKERALF